MGNKKCKLSIRIAGLQQWLMFLTCFLMMLAVAITHDGKIFGHNPVEEPQEGDASAPPADTCRHARLSGDTLVINTAILGKDIQGFNGPTPLEIYILRNKVVAIRALAHTETPRFFNRAFNQLKTKWNGKTISKAAALQVDAVSGATFSSKAIIQNVQTALNYAQTSHTLPASPKSNLSPQFICGLIVVLMAAILPLFIKNRWYRMVQMLLNIGVLGFWYGSFVSYASIIGFLSGGFHWNYLILILMIIVAFIYPLFGKKQYYCTYICPFGSLQQLMGKISGKKINMGEKWIRILDGFRQILWAVLMICLWTGFLFQWIDYELFTAFVIRTAPPIVIGCAIAVVLLSIFIQRPYCRFICPTGTLMKMAELGGESKIPVKKS